MHDFCFTIPYGLLVLVGGIVGYVRRGSTASLAGGAGSGLVLLLAGFVSLKAFEKRRNSYLALGLETGRKPPGSADPSHFFKPRILRSFFDKDQILLQLLGSTLCSICWFSRLKFLAYTLFICHYLSTACALALTFVMGKRYIETSKIMPAGVVAILRYV
ncbi:hypothetical protein BHM03_00015226 [Ensete ventricosum]|nr:hypothetical protein BHM03_00015226 [Ensete ventricosum]